MEPKPAEQGWGLQMLPCDTLPAACGTEKDTSTLQDESRAPQSGEMGQSPAQLSDMWAEAGALCEAGLDNHDLAVTPKP